ncbi:V-set and immunoglobulin domain-containing protein 1-like isoform X1 [Pelmatolapia mariae]|uniref:V-set and immunoglobulin domain-containing protein 1-like isoform X1 n=1 Tax=Pelmatolapia mariae TaxID=158779 RepID=UPI002FE53DE6
MELLPLLILSFCFLNLSGMTFAAESGPPDTNITVQEDDDVILPCSFVSSVNIESMKFDWKKKGTLLQKEVFLYDNGSYYNNGLHGQDEQFKGRVSHFSKELKNGNASIRINKTRLEDSGQYTCIFPDLQPERKIFRIELVVEPVLKVRNVTGASPKPYVTILKNKGQLQCEVPGAYFKPKVEWWDSDNKTLPSKTLKDRKENGLFYVIIQSTSPKPDCYRCVTTQMDIWHRISSEICVHEEPKIGWIVAGVAVGVLVLVVVGILVWCLIKKKKGVL